MGEFLDWNDGFSSKWRISISDSMNMKGIKGIIQFKPPFSTIRRSSLQLEGISPILLWIRTGIKFPSWFFRKNGSWNCQELGAVVFGSARCFFSIFFAARKFWLCPQGPSISLPPHGCSQQLSQWSQDLVRCHEMKFLSLNVWKYFIQPSNQVTHHETIWMILMDSSCNQLSAHGIRTTSIVLTWIVHPHRSKNIHLAKKHNKNQQSHENVWPATNPKSAYLPFSLVF